MQHIRPKRDCDREYRNVPGDCYKIHQYNLFHQSKKYRRFLSLFYFVYQEHSPDICLIEIPEHDKGENLELIPQNVMQLLSTFLSLLDIG